MCITSSQITASAAAHPLVWKNEDSQVALVPFPIPLRPTNPLSAFSACRECSELIRSMIISRLRGHDRSLSQQLHDLPDLSTLAENLMLRNIALVLLLSLPRNLWGFQLIFLSLSFRQWRVQHKWKTGIAVCSNPECVDWNLDYPQITVDLTDAPALPEKRFQLR